MMKRIGRLIEKLQRKRLKKIEKLVKENNDGNNKLEVLEDRSTCNKVRSDVLVEYKNKTWTETEEILTDTLKEQLGMNSMKIKRAY